MLLPARRSLIFVVALLALAGSTPAGALGGGQPFEAFHRPPGPILRGEKVVVQVFVQTSDFGEPTGSVFVRSGSSGKFTELSLPPNGARTVPASFLQGGVLEDYVVVHDSGSGATRRIPPTGAFRSWIRDSFPVVDLGRHRFGHVRPPDSIVAHAAIGDGPNQVAWFCPPEGLCEYPWSFDVGPKGEVWMLDPHHGRMVGWTPGHPDAPSRHVQLPFGAADIAIGPHGAVYVSGVKVGDPVRRLRLYAFAPNGTLKWHSHLLTELFNAHIRFGGDGVLYSVDPRYGWAPAIGADGRPLSVAEQRLRSKADHPLADDIAFVVRTRSSKEQRAALADGGLLRRAWRITSDNPMDESGVPDVVDGDPVLAFGVYEFQHHLMEHVVLRLSKTDGVLKRFSLGTGVQGGAEVTTLRVGYDGAFYQLQGSPSEGEVRVARYPLD